MTAKNNDQNDSEPLSDEELAAFKATYLPARFVEYLRSVDTSIVIAAGSDPTSHGKTSFLKLDADGQVVVIPKDKR